MGTSKPDPSDLSGDGIDRLREFFRNRFRGDGVVDAAVDGVLGEIADEWAYGSGVMTPDEYEKLQRALAPHTTRLTAIPIEDAKAAADAFVRAWRDVRPHVKWL